MKKRGRLIAALARLYAVLGAFTALIWLAVRASLPPGERQMLAELVSSHPGLFMLVPLVTAVGLGMVFALLYRRYVLTPLKMRDQLTIMLGAHPASRLPGEGPREMRQLAAAINQLAGRRDELASDLADRIAQATAHAEEEKNRFAALLAQLSQSVVVCNADCRILLYNERARSLFQGERGGPALIGLGRSIFGVIEPSLIAHGQEQIQQRLQTGDSQAQSTFVTATPAGRLIRARMTPVLQEPAPGTRSFGQGMDRVDGYVLILDDITRHVDRESQRDLLLQSLTEGARGSLASIRAAVETLSEYSDMDASQRERFIAVVREEAQVMSRRLEHALAEYADALKTRWPLEDMLGLDLIQAAAHRVEQHVGLPTKIEGLESGLWIKVDSFSLLQGISYLAARLKDEFQVREIRFRLGKSGGLTFIDVIWSGTVIGTETLLNWELEPMQAGGESTPLSLREIIERHDGELWFQRDKLTHRAYFRLLLPSAEAPPAPPSHAQPAPGRPEYYDFDLFGQTETSRALDDLLLSQLTYTVFDTETTGLEPSAGDQIIQIGAIRIVNGRLLKGEVFEQLIDPQRPVPATSTRIHGITGEMLAGQPVIKQVLPAFHAFCADTVLVAHNAAFDMRFLQMKERETGIAFRQPVLDTLLLSALVHPNQESHALEAIAGRLGVQVVGRHTALGDAMVTGEVLLKMIPLLAAQGIHTLRQAREASARTYYAKLGY